MVIKEYHECKHPYCERRCMGTYCGFHRKGFQRHGAKTGLSRARVNRRNQLKRRKRLKNV